MEQELSAGKYLNCGISGIYILTNKVNGRQYVGQTLNMRKRMMRYYNIDTDGQPKIDNALRKYGSDAFTFSVLIETANEDELNLYETEAIIGLDTKDNGYNCDYGGNNRHNSKHLTKEQIESVLHCTLAEGAKQLKCSAQLLGRECYRWFEQPFCDISTNSFYHKIPLTAELFESYRDSGKSTAQIVSEIGYTEPSISVMCHKLFNVPVAAITGYSRPKLVHISKDVLDTYKDSGTSMPVAVRQLNASHGIIDQHCQRYYGKTFAKHSGCYSAVEIEMDWIVQAKLKRTKSKDFQSVYNVSNNQLHYFIQKYFGCNWREVMNANEFKPLAA